MPLMEFTKLEAKSEVRALSDVAPAGRVLVVDAPILATVLADSGYTVIETARDRLFAVTESFDLAILPYPNPADAVSLQSTVGQLASLLSDTGVLRLLLYDPKAGEAYSTTEHATIIELLDDAGFGAVLIDHRMPYRAVRLLNGSDSKPGAMLYVPLARIRHAFGKSPVYGVIAYK